jgi:hypothetical protein
MLWIVEAIDQSRKGCASIAGSALLILPHLLRRLLELVKVCLRLLPSLPMCAASSPFRATFGDCGKG